MVGPPGYQRANAPSRRPSTSSAPTCNRVCAPLGDQRICTVLQETEWVLRYSYQFNRRDINNELLGLAGLENVYIDNPTVLMQALDWPKPD